MRGSACSTSYVGLVLADSTMGVPFAILILRAFMVSLPRSLVEAALCDGATHGVRSSDIILPLSRNGLITSGLFCFLFAWSDFIFALTLSTPAEDRADNARHLRLHRQRNRWNAHHGDRRAGLDTADRALARSASTPIAAGLIGGAVKE